MASATLALLFAIPLSLPLAGLPCTSASAQAPGALTLIDTEAPPSPPSPPPFTSDRPGFANTSGVAALGRVTAELGISGSFEEAAGSAMGSVSLPRLSLRAGLFDWLEARARVPGGVGVFASGREDFGFADPVVGFKLGGRLGDSLAISTVMEASLPLGTTGFGAPEAELFFDLNIDWRFWGPLTLTPNAVARVLAIPIYLGVPFPEPPVAGARRIFEGGVSLKLTWKILDVLSAYVQSYLLASEVSDVRVQVGGGLTWMALPNVQIDVSFDSRVTETGDPPTAGIGTTILF